MTLIPVPQVTALHMTGKAERCKILFLFSPLSHIYTPSANTQAGSGCLGVCTRTGSAGSAYREEKICFKNNMLIGIKRLIWYSDVTAYQKNQNKPICQIRVGLNPNTQSSQSRLAKIGIVQSALLKISTPFPKNRYQIIATFWERCHYFCQGSSRFVIKLEKTDFFYVLHNTFTAFASYIRGPPHLELLCTKPIDRRSLLWYGIEMRGRIPMKFCKIDLQHICCLRSKDGG